MGQTPLSVDDFMTKVSTNREPFRNCSLLPGARALLQTLSTKTTPRIHLALASSGERSIFDLKTARCVDDLAAIPSHHRIFGDDPCMAGFEGKPAPDIFIQSLQRLNDSLSPIERPIEPLECLVFEDSTAGVEAGRRAGMRVVWVPHPGLLEVYRGREALVLEGKVDEKGNVGGTADVDEEMKRSLPFSRDGRVELRESLEGFDYERYGIIVEQ